MLITITIPAVPVAQPRQRTRGFLDKSGAIRTTNYTPAKHPVNHFKSCVQMAFSEVYKGPPLDGPVYLRAVFVFPRPKRLIWKSKPMPRQRHWQKPDRDNCEKSLKDSLSKIAWHDDCQVCDGPIIKWIASGDEQPHVEITIRTLEEVPTDAQGTAVRPAQEVRPAAPQAEAPAKVAAPPVFAKAATAPPATLWRCLSVMCSRAEKPWHAHSHLKFCPCCRGPIEKVVTNG